MDQEEKASEITKIIPEAYFDILCRLIPGIVAVTAFVYFTGRWPITLSMLEMVVVIAIAYVIGTIIDNVFDRLLRPISILWSWRTVIEKHASDEQKNKLQIEAKLKATESKEEQNKSQNIKLSYDKKLKILETMRHNCRFSDPSIGAIITKLVAEERLVRSIMFISLFGPFIIALIGNQSSQPTVNYWTELLKIIWPTPKLILWVIILICCIIGWLHRIERSTSRAFFGWQKSESQKVCSTPVKQLEN